MKSWLSVYCNIEKVLCVAVAVAAASAVRSRCFVVVVVCLLLVLAVTVRLVSLRDDVTMNQLIVRAPEGGAPPPAPRR